MDFKKFIPDFGAIAKTNFAAPAVGKGNVRNTVLAVLSLLMVVAVFLPWFHWEYFLTGSGENPETTLEAYNKLGIASLWGILGFVVALVTLFGVLYKQYALAFWAAILAAIFGCFGSCMVTGFEFAIGKEDYIVFEESLKMAKMTDSYLPVTHIGAELFMVVAVLVAALSFVELNKKDEEAEAGCLAKLAFAVAAFVAFVICLDAAMVNATFLSVLATKILAWNLPLITVLLVAVAYFKGEGKSLNAVSVALLVVSFFFTNPATIEKKYDLINANDVKNIETHFQNAQDDSLVTCTKEYKELEKAAEKAAEKEEKKTTLSNLSSNEFTESSSNNGAQANEGSSECAANTEVCETESSEEWNW